MSTVGRATSQRREVAHPEGLAQAQLGRGTLAIFTLIISILTSFTLLLCALLLQALHQLRMASSSRLFFDWCAVAGEFFV